MKDLVVTPLAGAAQNVASRKGGADDGGGRPLLGRLADGG